MNISKAGMAYLLNLKHLYYFFFETAEKISKQLPLKVDALIPTLCT